MFMLATSINLVTRFSSGFLWKRYGLKKCYEFCFYGAVIIDIVYLTWAANSRVGFCMMIFFVRGLYGLNTLFNNMTLFTVYSIDKALLLSKYYDLNLIIVVLIGNVLNKFFVSFEDFRMIFVGFLILELSGSVAFRLNKQKLGV